jgi:hypothetical protein
VRPLRAHNGATQLPAWDGDESSRSAPQPRRHIGLRHGDQLPRLLSRQIGPRHYERLGAPPNSFLTPETHVEDEAGRAGTFLADLRTVVRDDAERHEATSVRPLRVNPVDVERLDRFAGEKVELTSREAITAFQPGGSS